MSLRKSSKKNSQSSKKSGKGIVKDLTFESPSCTYQIDAETLITILQEHSSDFKDRNTLTDLFNSLKSFEDYSTTEEPVETVIPDEEENTEEEVHQTAPPFKEKHVQALFWIPKFGYRYIPIKLAPSSIVQAGIGAYAMEDIPKGAKGVYKGVVKDEDGANMYYSWAVKSFHRKNGKVDSKDETLYYRDATDLFNSNWTRYVNCGLKSKVNNFESEQLFDTFFYVATKSIKSGEELFIDYGDEYRKDNLGMKGKY